MKYCGCFCPLTGVTPVRYHRNMPRKNSLKTYVEGGYYHIYNRGVEKRNIFLDDRDYKVLLHFLKTYLSPLPPKEDLPQRRPEIGVTPVRIRPIKTVHGVISLLAYCLMPNHFHLLVKQEARDGISRLMNRIGTNYGMYFNKRYERVGPLFQGVYKAVLIDNEAQFLHLSRYIHLNPYEIEGGDFEKLVDYPYSSYGDYLGVRNTGWVKTDEILSYFGSGGSIPGAKAGEDHHSYQSFVEDFKGEYDLTGATLDAPEG